MTMHVHMLEAAWSHTVVSRLNCAVAGPRLLCPRSDAAQDFDSTVGCFVYARARPSDHDMDTAYRSNVLKPPEGQRMHWRPAASTQ